MQRERFFFLDFLKAISIISVVSFHSVFVPFSTYSSSAKILEIIFSPLRFCVPVLLVISFFLLGRNLHKDDIRKHDLIRTRLIRLLPPTIFWFSLSTLLDLLTGKSVYYIAYRMLFGESFLGAYYLIVLFQLIPFSILFKDVLLRTKVHIVFAITLSVQYILFLTIYGLKYGDYSQVIKGIETLQRIPFWYWFSYASIGVCLYRERRFFLKLSFKTPLQIKSLVLLGLGVGFLIENAFLIRLFGNRTAPFEYFMFSCLISAPIVFLCCMNINPDENPLWLNRSISMLSKYSLGIFCINGILSRVFLSIGSTYLRDFSFSFMQILSIKLVGWIFLLLVSLVGSILLSKMGLKRMVC